MTAALALLLSPRSGISALQWPMPCGLQTLLSWSLTRHGLRSLDLESSEYAPALVGAPAAGLMILWHAPPGSWRLLLGKAA